MISQILKNFHWQRAADKLGPKRLLVVVVGGSDSKLVILNRTQKQVKVETCYTVGPFKLETMTFSVKYDDGTENEVSLGELCNIYNLNCVYCSVVYRKKTEAVRLVQVPSKNYANPADTFKSVKELIGAGEEDSVVYQALEDHQGKALIPVLGSSMAHKDVELLQQMVLSANMKAVSLVLGSVPIIALVRKFAPKSNEFRGYLYIGDYNSTLVVAKSGTIAMVRQFAMGRDEIIRSIMKEMGMDRVTALDVFNTDSFDYTAALKTQTPWIHQIGISLDYVEKRFNANVNDLLLFGPGSVSKVLSGVFASKVHRGVSPWDVTSQVGQAIDDLALVNENDYLAGIAEGLNVMGGGSENVS